jgi:hypothetical protein
VNQTPISGFGVGVGSGGPRTDLHHAGPARGCGTRHGRSSVGVRRPPGRTRTARHSGRKRHRPCILITTEKSTSPRSPDLGCRARRGHAGSRPAGPNPGARTRRTIPAAGRRTRRPQAARRTRRAPLNAPGSPRSLPCGLGLAQPYGEVRPASAIPAGGSHPRCGCREPRGTLGPGVGDGQGSSVGSARARTV